jgi:hypothetical protein
MRFAVVVWSLLLVISVSTSPPEVRAQDNEPVPYAPAWVNTATLAQGFYVFRDSTEWEEKFVREFPSDAGPPPAPDLSDSLIVALSYGMTGCYETGGIIESVLMEDGEVMVRLTHVYGYMPMCLAENPRVYFYRIAHADVPPDAEFVFMPAEPPYDVEAQRWYPLAVGNAWHYRRIIDLQAVHMVEVVSEAVEIDGRTWFYLETKHCSTDPCPFEPSRYLSWTDDDRLLVSMSPPGEADTLHAEFETSPFRANVPSQRVPLASGDSTWLEVRKYYGTDIRLLWGYGVHYFYDIGPADWLMGAIIDGEHYDDTSLILTVLSSERPAEVIANGRIDVYPHPATAGSVIAFVPERTGEIVLELFDLLGREVMSRRASVVAGTEWQTGLDTVLPPGAYFVRVVSESGNVGQRTIIVAR